MRPLPLMEDVDLVERLSLAGREAEAEERRRRRSRSRRRGGGGGGGGGEQRGERKEEGEDGEGSGTVNSRPAVARGAVETSGRRWAEKGLVKTTLLNLWTLARWKGGTASAEELAKEYYSRR